MARNTVEEDPSVNALVEAGTPVVSIFGKTWDLHVQRALGITEEENLKLISETVRYLKAHGKEVVYDAEHFFDGYTPNRDFALRTLEAAKKAGADVLCLCDTNGGTLTAALSQICADVRKSFDGCSASTPITIPIWPWPMPGRRGAGFRARAGLHERLRRALRQRQSGLDHRQSRIEDGPHHHRQGAPGRTSPRPRASSPNWRICPCAAISRSSATAPSRTRAACTSAPC